MVLILRGVAFSILSVICALAVFAAPPARAAVGCGADPESAKSIVAASELVLGKQLTAIQAKTYCEKMQNDPAFKDKALDGINFSEAAAYLRLVLTQPYGGETRATAINAAFLWVYGRYSSSTEQAFWDAKIRGGGLSYSEMIGPLTKSLNASAAERKDTILRAYVNAFGRVPTAAEYVYWTPRSEFYGQMLQGNRGWLYSTSGAEELPATVRRALQKRSGGTANPSDQEVKSAMAKASSSRMIYAEMIKMLY